MLQIRLLIFYLNGRVARIINIRLVGVGVVYNNDGNDDNRGTTHVHILLYLLPLMHRISLITISIPATAAVFRGDDDIIVCWIDRVGISCYYIYCCCH